MLLHGVTFAVSFASIAATVPYPAGHSIQTLPVSRQLSEGNATSAGKQQYCFWFDDRYTEQPPDRVVLYPLPWSVVRVWARLAMFGPGALPVPSLTDQYGAAPWHHPLYIVADGGLNANTSEKLQPLLSCFDDVAENRNISVVCEDTFIGFELDGCHRRDDWDWYNPCTWSQWHWLGYLAVAACLGCRVSPELETTQPADADACLPAVAGAERLGVWCDAMPDSTTHVVYTALYGLCWGPVAYMVIWAAALCSLLIAFGFWVVFMALCFTVVAGGICAVLCGVLWLGSRWLLTFRSGCIRWGLRDSRARSDLQQELRTSRTRSDLQQELFSTATTRGHNSNSTSTSSNGGRAAHVVPSVPTIDAFAEAIIVVDAQPLEVKQNAFDEASE